ncbi:desumoylating isopeptidase 1 [Selaginella moellendorffii]|nr:desumoylating isopeptidase 1 [Selaginella moellendorffii]|eukprot:XP_002976661.2 desumoylating isopeptidase 1 [Selaginella moellendorffii]
MAADGEASHSVVLYVYDLSQGLARQLSTSLLGAAIEGIWHTSVVVYGTEYYYSGGITTSNPGRTPYGRPVNTVELGRTQVPKEVFEDYLREISPRYTVQTYSILSHNCNNFSNEVAQFLLGVDIPDYILRLPQDVITTPMGYLLQPMIQQMETTLRYGGVPQVPELAEATGTPQRVAMARRAKEECLTTTIPEDEDLELQRMRSSRAVKTAKVASRGDEGRAGRKKAAATKMEDARAKVQEEITREFTALMAAGGLRASEAAALAARRVMERHGIGGSGTATQS